MEIVYFGAWWRRIWAWPIPLQQTFSPAVRLLGGVISPDPPDVWLNGGVLCISLAPWLQHGPMQEWWAPRLLHTLRMTSVSQAVSIDCVYKLSALISVTVDQIAFEVFWISWKTLLSLYNQIVHFTFLYRAVGSCVRAGPTPILSTIALDSSTDKSISS